MTAGRLFAVLFIFVCCCVAWFILGFSLTYRTEMSDDRLSPAVTQLWGGRHAQVAPSAWYETTRVVHKEITEQDAEGRTVTRQVNSEVVDLVPVPLASSRIEVDLDLEHRRKGLLWYDTYAVAFDGQYRLSLPDGIGGPLHLRFAFPSAEAIYDDFVFRVDGEEIPPQDDLTAGITAEIELNENRESVVEVGYRSRGLDDWRYLFVPAGVAQVRDFLLTVTTDFEEIDFPAGTLSPSTKSAQAEGWKLVWGFNNLVTGQNVGLDLPNRLNPGPVSARITFFAPVSLLFFMTVLVIQGMLGRHRLHPINYFFLGTAFFSFHLLLAYLVDHLDIHLSFLIAAAVSVVLVLSYLRLVSGMRQALPQVGLAQIVFLVLFSYAFFFEGYTGLTVTIGSILTLFVLMQATGRVEWEELFAQMRSVGGEGSPQGKPA
jgi:hypothetical protein